MPTRDRFIATCLTLVRVLIGLNIVGAILAIALFVATVVFAGPLESQLAAKYAGRIAAADGVAFVRFLALLVLPCAWAIHRLFAALAAILRTVQGGDPFIADNAARLRTIGWSLLAIQLLDLVLGAATWWATARGLDMAGWQPGLTGWLGVLIAFVLARVFTIGARLREDVEGTV
ncbi:hypothetical protein ASG29_01735 [Sphingomonas sp. Leaf412]|uniref:DUF2975 domain-containing protein n=1 Tax=Sphingomonas sp. Leaf412 TaxID=1736370 RepID=UPI0006F45DF4|nr:DUF2975 domain-containing protein [Sphingomonas sp. Leaf412]KQT34900.1 hypothetical protein ASG29_01735 [Sphingomonas sp. Leaf412]